MMKRPGISDHVSIQLMSTLNCACSSNGNIGPIMIIMSTKRVKSGQIENLLELAFSQ
jgi:hypothetical protein